MSRFTLAIAALIMLTSSFDIFLVLQAGGNFRFCQLLTMILGSAALSKSIKNGDVPTLGLLPLLAWWIVQLAFVPVTEFWPKSLGYCLWLILDLAIVFSFVQLFGENQGVLARFTRWYVYSFAVIAVLGLVQFALPLVGLQSPLVTEWWVKDHVARVNGFSYEPSYFASYLLIGFVLVAALHRAKIRTPDIRGLRAVYWLTASGIVVSSSRMGIIFLLLDVTLYRLQDLYSLFRSPFNRLHLRPNFAKSFSSIAILGLLAMGVFVSANALEDSPDTVTLLLTGTGLYGSPAHSVVQRESSFFDTLTVFRQQPFIGRSIGGVSSAIAELHGQPIQSFAESKSFEGMSVFAEALAGSGIIGVIPFVCFVAVTIYKPLQLAKFTSPGHAAWLRALVRSLLFEWVILQFNQNVLRPYLWIHIAVLATMYAAARNWIAGEISASRARD